MSTETQGRSSLRRRPRLSHRFLALGVALALVLPAAVLAGGQTFTDVPPTHKFFNDIEAVAAAGVTHGCGDGTKYCPDGLVTRGQMAAFMNRLGALGVGRTPVVNADRVDGLHGSDFLRSTRIGTGTIPFTAALGTRILLDPRTGADVRIGSSRTIQIFNTSASLQLNLIGISSAGTTLPPEPEFAVILPGQSVVILYDSASSTAGYIDVMLTRPGAHASDVRVSHLSCGLAKVGGDTEGWVSCVVVG